MLRRLSLLIVLLTANSLAAGGCRSCASCHDYDPPVADCGCSGSCRAGSVTCNGCGYGPAGCDCQETAMEGGEVIDGSYEAMENNSAS